MQRSEFKARGYLEFSQTNCSLYRSEVDLFLKHISKRILPTIPGYGVIYNYEYRDVLKMNKHKEFKPRRLRYKTASLKATENALVLDDINRYILGTLITATYHLWERQLIRHLKVQFELCREMFPTKNPGWTFIINTLLSYSTPEELIPQYDTINELRLITNSIKHGNGDSYNKLLALKTDITHNTSKTAPEQYGETPLLGISIYPRPEHLTKYINAISDFWDSNHWSSIGHIRHPTST